jgi:excisionase family DNA binding protein
MQTIRIKYGEKTILFNIKKLSKMHTIILKKAQAYSIQQASLVLGYTYIHTWKITKSGKLASEKVGQKRTISAQALADWLALSQPTIKVIFE